MALGATGSAFDTTVDSDDEDMNTLKTKLPKTTSEFIAMLKESPPGDNRVPPDTPSVPGFPPNPEVDANYIKLRAEIMTHSEGGNYVHVESFTHKSPFGPVTAGTSLEELSTVTLPQLLERTQPTPGAKLFLKVVQPALMMESAQALVEDEKSGHHVRVAVYNTTDKSHQV